MLVIKDKVGELRGGLNKWDQRVQRLAEGKEADAQAVQQAQASYSEALQTFAELEVCCSSGQA